MCSSPTGAASPSARWSSHRMTLAAVAALSLLTLSLPFAIPVSAATATTSPLTPTMTVKPDKGLIGNQTFRIIGKNWSSSSAVGLKLCGGTSKSPTGPCLVLPSPQPSRKGSWSATDEPVIGDPPAACKTACYFEASQGAALADVDLSVCLPRSRSSGAWVTAVTSARRSSRRGSTSRRVTSSTSRSAHHQTSDAIPKSSQRRWRARRGASSSAASAPTSDSALVASIVTCSPPTPHTAMGVMRCSSPFPSTAGRSPAIR